MSVFGVDYAWGRPGPVALKAAGVRFACRYLSHDTTGKNLTRSEAEILSASGISLVVVWETTAQRPLAGRAAGAQDAKDAMAQARGCGMPEDRPIYFAADWDASEAQQGLINAYLDGAASVLGRDRVGLYGGYWPVKRAFDAGKIAYGWQTYAWSGGRWDSRAQLQQYSNDERINGVGLDFDRAVADDYGQWKVGETPMALSADDKKWFADWMTANLFKLVYQQDKVPVPAGVEPGDNPTWQPINLDRETYSRILEIKALVAALAAQQPDVDEAAIAQQVVNALPDTLAQQVLDGLKARLES